MKLYRYLREYDDSSNPSIQLSEHEVVRETKQCYVISRWGKKKERFILKNSDGKRWAYDTKEKALESFKKRAERSIQISKTYIEEGEKYLKLANDLKL